MYDDEVLKMKMELDEVSLRCDELQKVVLMREEQLKKAEDTIQSQGDRIKFLEGQVDAYQYCLNCRR